MTPDIKNAPVPFFIKPITRGIAGRVESSFLEGNFKTHFDFLEGQLATSPDGGEYLCGKDLTGADILMSFPMIAAKTRGGGIKREIYPKLLAYIQKLETNEGYKRSIEKIEKLSGEPFKALL